MRVLSAAAGAEWTNVEPTTDAASGLERTFTQLLLAERLVVFTGLGTSRCITGDDGEPLAPTMDQLWEQAKESHSGDFERVLDAARWERGSRNDIELLLSRCQMAHELTEDPELRTFIERAEAAIVSACRFIGPETPVPVHEAFLRKVARRSTRLPRTQLFTTNYDLAFERAAARTGFALIDGFSHSQPQRFDSSYFEHDFAARDRERAAVPVEWIPNVLQLHKLHGSVDWFSSTDGGVERDAAASRPLIIYPRSNKFEVSYQQPFLELMARFQNALRRPDTGLLIVGSGFNDRHLSEPIAAALRTNVRLTAAVVDPALENATAESIELMSRLIQRGDRRLTLVAAAFEEVVPELPDLVPAMESERHEERLSLPATDD